MNVLFPVCGEGLGHSSRSLALGRYLEENGYSVIYAAYGKSYNFLKHYGCKVEKTYREITIEGENGFFSLKKSLWRSKGVLYNIMKAAYREHKLIEKYDVDIVITDSKYSALLAARTDKKPSLLIINQNYVRGQKNSMKIVGYFLTGFLNQYNKFADHIIIPDFKPPHTICEYNLRIPEDQKHKYTITGPIINYNPDDYELSEEYVFATFGGEPFKLPLYRILKEIADTRPDLSFLVSTGGESGMPKSSKNFRTFRFVDDFGEYLSKARMTMLHGGLVSLHESLAFGKPVMIIVDPYHPEQFNNARKVVKMKAGVMVDPTNFDKKMVEEAIDKTLSLDVSRFMKLFKKQDGKKNALKIIQGLEYEEDECS